MDINYIQTEMQRIAEISGNCEIAHSLEDDLHLEVLTAIANGVDNAQALAIFAIKTAEISFTRYCG